MADTLTDATPQELMLDPGGPLASAEAPALAIGFLLAMRLPNTHNVERSQSLASPH